MSNRPFQRHAQQPAQAKVQIQCVNCRTTQWIRGPEQLAAGSTVIVRWDCQRCHFNNQTSFSGNQR